MSKVLRREIIKDVGHSQLKKKVLDLVTKLRLEKAVMQMEKDEVKAQKEADE